MEKQKLPLIGPAAHVEGIVNLMAEEVAVTGESVKLLLYGAPGVGKTDVANRLALQLTNGQSLGIESLNGKEIDIAKVRAWRQNIGQGNIWSDWQVILINELDKASADAQVLMLTLMDELPARRAIIATSNLQLDLLHERFQTRFTQYKVDAPSYEDIETLLQSRYPGLLGYEYTAIANGSGGNVRAALNDAKAAQLAARHAARLVTKKPVKASAPADVEADFWSVK